MLSINLQVTLCLLYSNCGGDSSPIFVRTTSKFDGVISTARDILRALKVACVRRAFSDTILLAGSRFF